MSRYRGPRLRLVRRLGELPGLLSPKKSYQLHGGGTSRGQNSKKLEGDKKSSQGERSAPQKESQYSVRLKEKQKVRFHYGVTESQLLKYVKEARNAKGSTGELLLKTLEMRLDNVLFRLGMAPTMAAARQLITHGHIQLNGKKVNIPSHQCIPNDKISVPQSSRQLITGFLEKSYLLPEHLQLTKDNLEGTVNGIIKRESIGLNVNELLVVEFYSRKV
ncbi:30S ribosomal protein S4 [bacterium]|nr:MAG: 30S ribosomal protein S4 [bacterium]